MMPIPRPKCTFFSEERAFPLNKSTYDGDASLQGTTVGTRVEAKNETTSGNDLSSDLLFKLARS